MAATLVEGPSSKLEGDKSSETSGGSTPSLDTPGDVPRKVKGQGGKEVKDGTGTLRRLNLKMSFRTLAQKKVEKPPDKNEPSRFLGEGVSFKAKLIGILEVSEARGDRMCQEALADLKMAIRAAGEHKQRITINIAIDGLRLRDEKNGDCLYHHPVHKISFIAQDMSDSRAFGYIFGSPDTGHRFFGIKTDKAASQVVIAMRDLFQVVFELKKKEIEMAKQHIELHQIKISSGIFPEGGSSSKNGVGSISQVTSKVRSILEDVRENGNASSSQSTHKTSEVIADLLDLEFELNSIQQGIHQMERITPSDPFGPSSMKDSMNSDPFGDSFAPTATLPPPPKTVRQPVAILPPPPAVKEPSPRPSDPFNVPPPSRQPQRRGGVRGRTAAAERFNEAATKSEPPPAPAQEKHWFDQETESLFSEGELVSPPFVSSNTSKFTNLAELVGSDILRTSPSQQSSQFDVFTDLDPLGTGRSKPYIDRKDFFQDLKNPPKKVLKDLVTEAPAEATAPLFQATFDPGSNRSSGASDGLETNISNTNDVAVFPPVEADPFHEEDPFYRTDPFVSADSSNISAFPSSGGNADPFDTGFADFSMFGRRRGNVTTSESSQESTKRTSPQPQTDSSVFSPRTNFHGPLRVSLPPEKPGANPEEGSPPFPSNRQSGRSTSSSIAKPRTKSRLHKQNTLSGLPKLPSPKSSQRSTRLSKQMTVDGCISKSHLSAPVTPPTPQRYDRRSPHLESVTLRSRVTPSPPVVACFPDIDSRLSSSSIELSEIAPEPPPRPASNGALIKPPPLPPKRQQAINFVLPPRPISRSPSTDTPMYYYIGKDGMSSSPTVQDEEVKSPPIPVPARRPRFGGDDAGVAPERPRRHHPVVASKSDDDYLAPISFALLPPPQRSQADVPTTLASLIPTEAAPVSGPAASTSLNLTLSQLTKTGFADLAMALRMSPGQLSNMTLQELTLCLAKLSNTAQDTVENVEESNAEKVAIKREKYSTLRESVDEEPMFKAEFENNFGDEDSFEKPPEDVFQETLFDKYAVFRELISEEKTEEQPEVSEEAGISEEPNLSEEPITTETSTEDGGDRYAALRDISLEDEVSDREDSIKDDDDALPQRSESTESPTMETATMREPQSIIETTIYEEDTLEADNDEVLEDVPDIMEDVEEEEEFKSPSAMGSRESLDHEQTQPEHINISPEQEKEEEKTAPESTARDEESGESWAKFDAGAFPPTKPASEGQSEEVSPWSSDGKEFGKVQSPAWQQPFDPEQESDTRRGRMRRRSPWQEEGEERRPGEWRENGWSDGESFYEDPPMRKERVYHEERRRRVSPWRGQRSSRDVSPWEHGRYADDDEEEEYEAYWKTRPKHRGSSWDDEQRRRYEPRDNGLDYEDGRKRRLSPWSGEADRRSSRESVNWEDEERYSQRREEEFRRRREQESYSWEYGRHSGRRYYRDRSRESPWEDEGDDESPQYPSSKRGWSKRPSSGPERRPSDKSPGEFKVKGRYREKVMPPHSREGHFNSDQEYDYWPPERARREPGYETRSQTLHSRRPNKYKKGPERSYSQKSPFDDDFTSHSLSISNSDIMKSGEGDAVESAVKKKSPINPAGLFTYTDAFPRRRDTYLEDIRPTEMVPSSPLDPQDSPLEDSGRNRSWRNRQSPFEDDFTPPNSGRRISSVSSEVSDHRRSPYDERPGRRVPSVAEEKEGIGDKNGRMSDDVFLPCEGGPEPGFADFDNGTFVNRDSPSGRTIAECCRRNERRILREEGNRREKNRSKGRISGLKVDPLNIKKSESVNIFTREKDPFDDDEFFKSDTPQNSTRVAEKANNNNGDPFKWTKAFDSFNFDDEK